MIVTILLVIIITYIVTTSIMHYITSRRFEEISIKEAISLTGNPIIVLENNGKLFNFILDTGANKSMIDKTVLQECNYNNTKKLSKNIGIEGQEEQLSIINLKLKGKKSEYQEEFLVRDLTPAFEKVKEYTGITIHGLIGTTFLTRYKYVLDFDELVIYSKRK